MEKSKVYFTDLRAKPGENLLQKLEKLVKAAGIETIDFNKKFTAIKIHFGEPGNLAYLRPNYSKVIVDLIKSLGGKVFLTDCNTLYVGRRKDGLEHLDAAYENGYNPFTTGCHIVIADGIKGIDEELVHIDGEYVQEAKIGKAIMDADILISLNHFKGHEAAGFGGAIKNIGMGSGSRGGKMEMHSDGKPFAVAKKCVGCKKCIQMCAHDAIELIEGKAKIDHDKCVGCGRCIAICVFDAIKTDFSNTTNTSFNCKMAEYAHAVLKDRPHFHINFLIDVSPFCDCHSENDLPIIPDVGMFASFDPVAIDMVCADMANQQPIISGSALSDANHDDHFIHMHPTTDWKVCLNHAEKIGIGTKNYELIKI